MQPRTRTRWESEPGGVDFSHCKNWLLGKRISWTSSWKIQLSACLPRYCTSNLLLTWKEPFSHLIPTSDSSLLLLWFVLITEQITYCCKYLGVGAGYARSIFCQIRDPSVLPHLNLYPCWSSAQIHLLQAGAAALIRLYGEKSFCSGLVFHYINGHMQMISMQIF